MPLVLLHQDSASRSGYAEVLEFPSRPDQPVVRCRSKSPRQCVEGVFRYRPTVDRESTESKLAADFLTEFFDGSATSLVLSLLGSKLISRNEIKRLKALLEKPEKGQS